MVLAVHEIKLTARC